MGDEVQITADICCDKSFENTGSVDHNPDSHGGGYESTD